MLCGSSSPTHGLYTGTVCTASEKGVCSTVCSRQAGTAAAAVAATELVKRKQKCKAGLVMHCL
jgi:hypothetical protein